MVYVGVFLTTSNSNDSYNNTLGPYNNAIREVANAYGFFLADVNAAMNLAKAQGAQLMQPDGFHPNLEGHRIFARVVLDTLGFSSATVPHSLLVALMPGTLRSWQLRVAPGGAFLSDSQAAALTPDGSWLSYVAPQSNPVADWVTDMLRRRGFVVDLKANLGNAPLYQGVGNFYSSIARTMYLNIDGRSIYNLWLNGQRVYSYADYDGSRPGAVRIPVQLQKGNNKVVVEVDGVFYVGFTINQNWAWRQGAP